MGRTAPDNGTDAIAAAYKNICVTVYKSMNIYYAQKTGNGISKTVDCVEKKKFLVAFTKKPRYI